MAIRNTPPAALAATAAVLALGACATASHSDPLPSTPGICTADPVQRYVGQRASAELSARLLAESGARQLRWGPPNSAMTMDYREDRLTVSYDANMVIERLSCG